MLTLPSHAQPIAMVSAAPVAGTSIFSLCFQCLASCKPRAEVQP